MSAAARASMMRAARRSVNARRVARPALLRASSGAAADDNTWSWVPPARTKDKGRKARAPSRFPATTAPLDRGDVLAILEDAGAVDVETIALPADAPGDAMVLASALSPKHLRSLADAVLAEAKRRGRPPRADGVDDPDWVSVDLDAVVVQLLTEHARADLQLEALWDPRRRDPQAEPPPE